MVGSARAAGRQDRQQVRAGDVAVPGDQPGHVVLAAPIAAAADDRHPRSGQVGEAISLWHGGGLKPSDPPVQKRAAAPPAASGRVMMPENPTCPPKGFNGALTPDLMG